MELLKKLCQAPGVSGDEGAVRDIVKEEIAPYVEEMRVDALGSVIARAKGTAGKGPKVLLLAHIDEVGFYIRGANEDGLLSFVARGIDPRVLCSKRVLVGKKKLPGIIGTKAIHLQSREEFTRMIPADKLYIDIGAKNKAEAEGLVPPGETACFDSDFVEFGENLVKAKALDDRVACRTIIEVLKSATPACELWVGFTTQEEVGLRGATAVAYSVMPDIALIMEGTTAGDVGEAESRAQVCNLGRGVTISFADTASIGHPGMVAALKNIATANNIPWQAKRFVSGGNDGGAVQTNFGPVVTAVVSVPCRYIHSPASVMHTGDMQAQVDLARAFVQDGAALSALKGA